MTKKTKSPIKTDYTESGLEDQDTCEHEFDPDEGYMCLNCGYEGLEDMMARAYDDAKDRMYD